MPACMRAQLHSDFHPQHYGCATAGARACGCALHRPQQGRGTLQVNYQATRMLAPAAQSACTVCLPCAQPTMYTMCALSVTGCASHECACALLHSLHTLGPERPSTNSQQAHQSPASQPLHTQAEHGAGVTGCEWAAVANNRISQPCSAGPSVWKWLLVRCHVIIELCVRRCASTYKN